MFCYETLRDPTKREECGEITQCLLRAIFITFVRCQGPTVHSLTGWSCPCDSVVTFVGYVGEEGKRGRVWEYPLLSSTVRLLRYSFYGLDGVRRRPRRGPKSDRSAVGTRGR